MTVVAPKLHPFAMYHETFRWQSPLLGREMRMQVIGHGGARVLVFPTSMGTDSEWPDRRMHEVLRDHLDNGWIQLYCLDQPHNENWGNEGTNAGHRAWTHINYFRYVREEVLPFTASKNADPTVIVAGASLGATHAMTYALKYPDTVGRVIGMSGMYDITKMTGGYSDQNVYQVNPMAFLPNEHDPGRIAAMQRLDIVMAIGEGDPMHKNNAEFSALLWRKGIGNAFRTWQGHAHDWPVWEKMIRIYIGGHD